MQALTCHRAHVEVRGQPAGVSFHHERPRSRTGVIWLNSKHLTQAEPPHQPGTMHLKGFISTHCSSNKSLEIQNSSQIVLPFAVIPFLPTLRLLKKITEKNKYWCKTKKCS